MKNKYCYPNTNVLINEYNIKDKETLEKLEIQKVSVKLLRLYIDPLVINVPNDIEHLIAINLYLFGEIYPWAGNFRKENIEKAERVLSGASAEYCNYPEIFKKLNVFFSKFSAIDWNVNTIDNVVSFVTELWNIHPFREGNTRTCITFTWHYLLSKNIKFNSMSLGKNPRYVRDSLVMANYDEYEYIKRIIKDALNGGYFLENNNCEYTPQEDYKISKQEYQAFKEKYKVKK